MKILSLMAIALIVMKQGSFSQSCSDPARLAEKGQDDKALSLSSLNVKRIMFDKKGVLSSDLEKGYDLKPFSHLSDNEEMVKLLAYLANNPDVYQNRDAKIINENEDKLLFKDKEIFNAPYIYKYSISENNVVAIESITSSEFPSYKNTSIDFDVERRFFPVSYGEIWIIEENKKPYRISPSNMNASNPCISNNGNRVAFTVNVLDQTNSLTKDLIAIFDLETNSTQYFSSQNLCKDHYTISPVMWINNGQILRTIEDWGETGGHGRVGYIHMR